MTRKLKSLAPAIPSLAVIIGLYLLENAWAAILLYHAGLVIVLTLGKPGGVTHAFRSGWHAPAAMAASIVCAAGGGLIYVLWPHIALEDVMLSETLSRVGLAGTSWWLFGVYFVVVHPVLEEIGWRCYLAPARQRPHPIDMAFAGYHVLVLVLFVTPFWVVIAFAVLVFASWGWRWVVRWKSGLGVALVSHAAANLCIFLAATFVARG